MTESESDGSIPSDTEAMKIFASEDEIDSFSGFSSPKSASNTAKKIISENMESCSVNVNKDGVVETRRSKSVPKGKGPGKNNKGKAPMKRKSSISDNSKKAKSSKKDDKPSSLDDFSVVMQNMFSKFTDNLFAAINLNQSNYNEENLHDNQDSENVPPCNVAQNDDSQKNNASLNMNDLFGSDSDDDVHVNHDEIADEEDFIMPNIFEDSEKFGSEVHDSIAKIVDAVIRKKSDVTTFIKMEDNKIPSNCKGLNPAVINPEIWQNLDRRARGQDLMFQIVQKLLGQGIVPILRMANLLKEKKVDHKLFKELTSRAIIILCNTFFELSVRRRMLLRPQIDRRFQQLINRNEPVGIECLFGDEVSKRLRDINEAHKLNRSLSNSKNFRRPAAQNYYRGRYTFNRGTSRGSTRPPWTARGQYPRNCRLQAFQGLNKKKP